MLVCCLRGRDCWCESVVAGVKGRGALRRERASARSISHMSSRGNGSACRKYAKSSSSCATSQTGANTVPCVYNVYTAPGTARDSDRPLLLSPPPPPVPAPHTAHYCRPHYDTAAYNLRPPHAMPTAIHPHSTTARYYRTRLSHTPTAHLCLPQPPHTPTTAPAPLMTCPAVSSSPHSAGAPTAG